MKDTPCILSPKHQWFWVTSTVIVFIAIVVIKIALLYATCDKCGLAMTVCNIFEGIAFSYIAAGIFQWFVVYVPHQRRKKTLTPLIKRHLWKIRESLRICTMTPNTYTFNLNGKYQSKEDFVEDFSKCNLLDTYMSKERSRLDRINDLKEQIGYSVDILLSNKEYLSDTQLEFVNNIITSYFMQNMLIPNDEACDSYSKNQDMMGECIYDLYEEAKAFSL